MRNLSVVLFDRATLPYLHTGKEIFGPRARYLVIPFYLQNRTSSETTTLEMLYSSSADIKIAVIEDDYEKRSSANLAMFDAVIVITPEIIINNDLINRCKEKYNNSNLFVIAGGKLQWITDNSDVYYYPWLMLNVSLLNVYRPIANSKKEKLFDCLLGSNKPHRKFVFDSLVAHQIIDKCYVNLLSTNQFNPTERPIEFYRSTELDLLESTEALIAKSANDDVFYSMQHTLPRANTEQLYRISNQVPWGIYENSYYSIIAETNDNSTFLTEKTAKALFAKRVFVMFGAQYHLKALRECGFQTFDSILDESYDNIEDNEQRWAQAFEQVMWLATQDPEKIYQQAQDILDYNYLKLCDHKSFIDPLRKWLLEKLQTCIVDISLD